MIELVARPVALQRTTLRSPHRRRRPSRSQRGCRSPLLAWRTWQDTSVARKSSSLGARVSFSSSTTKRPSARPGSTARPTWQVGLLALNFLFPLTILSSGSLFDVVEIWALANTPMTWQHLHTTPWNHRIRMLECQGQLERWAVTCQQSTRRRNVARLSPLKRDLSVKGRQGGWQQPRHQWPAPLGKCLSPTRSCHQLASILLGVYNQG